MNFEAFHQSLAQPGPPAILSVYLKALWLDGHGDWHAAHDLVNDLEDSTACWVHAYLHRKEGDIGNADYWYRRSGKKRPDISLAEEWESIVKDLLLKVHS